GGAAAEGAGQRARVGAGVGVDGSDEPEAVRGGGHLGQPSEGTGLYRGQNVAPGVGGDGGQAGTQIGGAGPRAQRGRGDDGGGVEGAAGAGHGGGELGGPAGHDELIAAGQGGVQRGDDGGPGLLADLVQAVQDRQDVAPRHERGGGIRP